MCLPVQQQPQWQQQYKKVYVEKKYGVHRLEQRNDFF